MKNLQINCFYIIFCICVHIKITKLKVMVKNISLRDQLVREIILNSKPPKQQVVSTARLRKLSSTTNSMILKNYDHQNACEILIL